MPVPLLPTAIAGAAAIGGAGLSALAQSKINRQQMRFQKQMFDKTNIYNSPLEQRKRLEAAGLNPNLVYGQSSGAASGQASQPSAPDLKAPDYTTAGAQLGGAMSDYYTRATAASNINVNQAREENIKQDTVNKGIDAVNKAIQSGSGSIDLKTKNRLYNNTIQTAEERLKNLSVNTNYTDSKNTRENMITTQTVQKLQGEIQNLQKQGRILDEEGLTKRLDNELYQEYKIRPSDPMYYRIIGEILKQLNINPFKK